MSIKKKLWLRLGVSLELTEEEFYTVNNAGPMGEAIIRGKVEIGDFVLDGETYAPENSTRAGNDEWMFDEDIEFDFYPRKATR